MAQFYRRIGEQREREEQRPGRREGESGGGRRRVVNGRGGGRRAGEEAGGFGLAGSRGVALSPPRSHARVDQVHTDDAREAAEPPLAEGRGPPACLSLRLMGWVQLTLPSSWQVGARKAQHGRGARDVGQWRDGSVAFLAACVSSSTRRLPSRARPSPCCSRSSVQQEQRPHAPGAEDGKNILVGLVQSRPGSPRHRTAASASEPGRRRRAAARHSDWRLAAFAT